MVDFGENSQLRLLREMVREFAQREVLPLADELGQPEGEYPYHLVRRMGELGLIGMTVPVEYGGNMMGHLARMVAIEEAAYWYPALGSNLRGVNIVPYVLTHFGTEEQKRRFLPGLVRGEIMSSLATTEHTGGSDPQSIQTSARKVGDTYVISGRKTMITRGRASHVLLISAKVEGRITAFLVEKGTPGLIPGRRETMSSVSAFSPVDEVILDECVVPAANMVGSEGRGLGPILAGINAVGRAGGAAVCLGIARFVYDVSLKYAKERELYGKPLANLQSIAFWLAEMAMSVEIGRLLNYKFAWLLDQGRSPREVAAIGAMAKLHASQSAVRNTLRAIEIHGGYGTAKEFKLIQRMNTALDMISAAGADNVMRQAIAREILA